MAELDDMKDEISAELKNLSDFMNKHIILSVMDRGRNRTKFAFTCADHLQVDFGRRRRISLTVASL